MSTSPTAQVLAQWDEWSSRCTDRLFDLDARVNAQGSTDDQLDIAAVFVARKAIVERIEAMRAAGGRDERSAASLAGQPLVGEQGAPVASDLSAAATLVDAIMSRIEEHLTGIEVRETELVRSASGLAAALSEAEELSESLGSHVKRVADLRLRETAAGRDLAAISALADESGTVLTELRVASAERDRILAAVPGVLARLDTLRSREAAVRALVEEVREKVLPLPKLAVPAVDALGPVPDHVDLPWPAARDRLQPYLTRVDRLGAALDEVERQFRAALDRRNDLRGLLQAYRDKAGERRFAEDPRVELRYQAARDVLWSAPCDLGVAAPLVTAYSEAVNAVIAGKDVGGAAVVSDAQRPTEVC